MNAALQAVDGHRFDKDEKRNESKFYDSLPQNGIPFLRRIGIFQSIELESEVGE